MTKLVNEALIAIRETEEKAEKLMVKAREKREKIVEKSREEAKVLVDKRTKEVREKVIKMIEKAREDGGKESTVLIEHEKKAAEKSWGSTKEKRVRAVETVVKAVLEG